MWIAGRAFHEIHTFLFDQDVRFSGDRITIDDVVTICESAFGYDLAMVVATMADLTEENRPTSFSAIFLRSSTGMLGNPSTVWLRAR
jgi:hypothetical protein